MREIPGRILTRFPARISNAILVGSSKGFPTSLVLKDIPREMFRTHSYKRCCAIITKAFLKLFSDTSLEAFLKAFLKHSLRYS